MTGEHSVGRVIARPFAGEQGAFRRTEGRRDFALRPPGRSYLEELQDAGVEVHGVGKISDLFAGVGVSESHPGSTNERALASTGALLDEVEAGLVFVNLIDTDQVHGHRKDVQGFHRALQEIDAQIGGWLTRLRDGDLLIVTADHGVDPAHTGTDHTREYSPLLAVSGEMVRRREAGRRAGSGANDGQDRLSAHAGPRSPAMTVRHNSPLADVGATVLRWLADRDGRGAAGEDRSQAGDAMPELPEVETIRRQLAPLVEGRTLARIEILDPRWSRPLQPRELAAALQGRRVEKLDRRGKYLVWSLEDDVHLAQHLRMTGAVLCEPAGAQRFDPPHVRVRLISAASRASSMVISLTRAGSAPASCCSGPMRWRRSSRRAWAASRSTSASLPSICARSPMDGPPRSRRCCSISGESRASATSTPTRRCSVRAFTRCVWPGGYPAISMRGCVRRRSPRCRPASTRAARRSTTFDM